MIRQSGFEYEFNPKACDECGGKCCTGESGNIWISEFEMERLSSFLGLDLAQFKKRFTKKIGVRYSLKEKGFEGGFACAFFDTKNRNCSIYELRPKQCVSFPFWDYFKKNYSELERECIGIKRF